MFRRRRVQPAVDPYITRRYEDIAVCIYHDIRNGRGRYSYYAPWLERMLERIPSGEYRLKHSLMPREPLSGWPEEGKKEEGGKKEEEEEGGRNGMIPHGPIVRGGASGRSQGRLDPVRQQAWSRGDVEEEEERVVGRNDPAPTRSRLCTIL